MTDTEMARRCLTTLLLRGYDQTADDVSEIRRLAALHPQAWAAVHPVLRESHLAPAELRAERTNQYPERA